MAIYETEALVLHRVDFSNTSQILDLFSRERGRVSVLAKGAREYSRRAFRLVDLLYHGRAIVFEKPSREIQILADFETITHFPGLGRRLDRYHAGLHLLNLLRRATRPEAAERRLFGLAVKALGRFAAASPDRLPGDVIAFDVRLLGLLGFAPVLDGCPECGRRHAPAAATCFRPAAGGCLCPACAPAAPPGRDLPLTGAGRRLLQQLGRLASADRDRLELEARPLAEARKTLNLALTWWLEAELPMLRYLLPP
ncbi:MAG: DNA repair protein RecO [Planctomycetes bacterium]|nr:DNA repair protein RecO [Planctomycetota bacterium]